MTESNGILYFKWLSNEWNNESSVNNIAKKYLPLISAQVSNAVFTQQINDENIFSWNKNCTIVTEKEEQSHMLLSNHKFQCKLILNVLFIL